MKQWCIFQKSKAEDLFWFFVGAQSEIFRQFCRNHLVWLQILWRKER